MTKAPKVDHARLLTWIALSFLVFVALFATLQKAITPVEAVPAPSIRCDGVASSDFQCWKKHYEVLTRERSAAVAFADMKTLYARDPYIVSQCHQLAHVVGNTAAELHGGDVAEAFTEGDSFCWSGYYHGVIERAVGLQGRDNVVANLDGFCARIPGKERYSFDYYNCVHGLGHGIMSITRNELFESLDLCNGLSGMWERQSCWGGAFMENVMADNRNHRTKYLKTDDLMYPCTGVAYEYKQQCYLMQTSYALSKNGYDFKDVFERCANVDEDFRDTCAESAGRDASGSSISDTARTTATCALARDDRQHEHCLVGAVKDFISYLHDDARAKELCAAAPERFRASCLQTAADYYQTFK